MNLFNTFLEWKDSRYQQHVSLMKEQNKCPECNGKGYFIVPTTEFVYSIPPYDCYPCNGTGTYTEWTNLNRTT